MANSLTHRCRVMQDSIFRAIVVLTLIIVFVAFAASQNYKNDSSHYAQENDINMPGQRQEQFLGISPDGWTATFTGALAVLTLILAIISAIQSSILFKTDKTARMAAEAAQKSADALQATERANIFEAVGTGAGFDHLFISGEFYKNSPSMDEQESQPALVDLVLYFKNYGKTPANIISYRAEIIISKETPNFVTPLFLEKSLEIKFLIQSIVEPGANAPKIIIERYIQNSWAQSNSLATRELNLWFTGHVTFIDVFDIKRTRKFVWAYDRPMRQFVPSNSTSTIEIT